MRTRASSVPRPGGTRQSTAKVALEGITLILSEARIFVGARLTPSIGSSIRPSTGSRAPRRSRAARAASPSSDSSGSPRAASSARGTSVTSNEGCVSARRWSSGAIFRSALSPSFGIEACAATPDVVTVKRKTPFSAQPTPYTRSPSLSRCQPPPSLSSMSLRTLSGCVSVSHCAPSEPPVSSSTTTTTSRSPARGTPAAAGQGRGRDHLRGRLGLHVERPAAPHVTVGEIARPRVVLPLARIREDGVDVREQAQRRTVGLAAQPGDEVRPLLGAAEQLALEARLVQKRREVFLGGALVARGVDGVEADQPLEDIRGLRLHVRRRLTRPLAHVTDATQQPPPRSPLRRSRGSRRARGRTSPARRVPSGARRAARPAPRRRRPTPATPQSGAAEGR